MTIDEAILRLRELRQECGGETEVVTSHGPVTFKLAQFHDEGISECCVTVCDENGTMV
jgi:hypothetical protein